MTRNQCDLVPRYDDTKWHFDEDAGEYYPITDRIGNRYVYNLKPRAQRELEAFKATRQFRQTRMTCIVSWIGLAFSSKLFSDAVHQHPPMMEIPIAIFLLWPFGLFAFGSTILMIYQLTISLPAARRMIGPPSMPPLGRQQVEDEQAYGPGGRLTGDELMEAARGYKRHPGVFETFDDEW